MKRSWPRDVVLLVLVSLLLRLLVFCGFGLGDDFAYAAHVNEILRHGYPDTLDSSPFLVRPLLLSVLTLSVRFLGWSETALVLPVLLASLVGIVSTYFLGLLLSGRTTGFLAAGALSLFPLDWVNSTTLTNDILGSAILAVGAIVVLVAVRRERKALMLAACGGLVIGLTTAVKLNFLLVIVPLLACLSHAVWRGRVTAASMLSVGGGWVAAQLLLAGFCTLKAGDPLAFIRVETAFNLRAAEHLGPDVASALRFYPKMVFRTGAPGGYGWDVFPLGWFFFLAFACLALAAALEIRVSSVAVVWFLFLMLAMQFWPLQLSPYIPIHRLPRFLHIAAVPAALVIGTTLGELWRRGKGWREGVFLLGVVYAIASLVAALHASSRHDDCMADPRQIARYVATYDGPVYSDDELRQYLLFTTGFEEPGRLHSDYIYEGSLVIQGGCRRPELGAVQVDPRFIVTPPESWVPVFELRNEIKPWRSTTAKGYVARR